MSDNNVQMQVVDAPASQAPAVPKDVTVTDGRGRVIGIKKPPFLAQFRLTEALGQSANNDAYMNMVFPVLYVSSVDGDPVATPTTKLQVEAILQRLDEDGYAAVFEGITTHFQVASASPKEQVKNA